VYQHFYEEEQHTALAVGIVIKRTSASNQYMGYNPPEGLEQDLGLNINYAGEG
jgi:hypothetical protein